MTGAQLESFIRAQSGMNASKVTQAEVFQYVNIIREEVRAKIEDKVGERFWHGAFTESLVNGTNKYDLDGFTGTGKISKITDVEITWDSNNLYPDYLDARNGNDQGISRGELKAILSESEGFWVYEGNNIVLYPSPTNDVTDGLTVYATYTFDDIDQTASDGDIFPGHPELKNYEYIIGLGVIPFMERQRNIKDKDHVARSKQDYMDALDTMIKSINSKYPSTVYGTLPNTKYFKH